MMSEAIRSPRSDLRSTDEPAEPREVRIAFAPAGRDERCRCGAAIPAGTLRYQYEGLPDPLGPIVGEASFCHILCVRSWILEALESLEANGREAIVSDLRETYCAVQELSSLMELELESVAFRSSFGP
jgi:hypothetical protein